MGFLFLAGNVARLREYVTHVCALLCRLPQDYLKVETGPSVNVTIGRIPDRLGRNTYILSRAVNQLAATPRGKESEKRDSSGSLSENSRPG